MNQAARATVTVGDRTLSVTNLDKVLYPATGTTKAEVISYYVAVAGPLLAQVAGRPVTRLRWPHGTAAASFFEKNIPAGTPEWIPRVTLDAPGSTKDRERITYPLVTELATLTWLANLGALELHTPQWRVNTDGADATQLNPDRMVIDLDPGPGAGLSECAQLALLVRQTLADIGLTRCVPVTSGSKGLQLYADLPGSQTAEAIRDLAKMVADTLATAYPELVVSSMTKALRTNKVLLDWSQNTAAKTTITPYSLRGKGLAPYVAAPRTWTEIDAGAAQPDSLAQLTPTEVIQRLADDGDLMAAPRADTPNTPARPARRK